MMKKDFQRFVIASIVGALVVVAGCQNKKPKLADDEVSSDTMEQLQTTDAQTKSNAPTDPHATPTHPLNKQTQKSSSSSKTNQSDSTYSTETHEESVDGEDDDQ